MSLLSAFTRLSLYTPLRHISSSTVNRLQVTPVLCAEPLKKKRKIDPQVIRQREDRRKKKLEKQIRRLEKNARQLKPIDELEVPLELLDEKDKRARNLTAISGAEQGRRALLNKTWTIYKHQEKVNDFQVIDKLFQSQQKALDELRQESEELYQEAIQIDVALLPITLKGPVATPPIEGYVSPDGDYIHEAKKWD